MAKNKLLRLALTQHKATVLLRALAIAETDCARRVNTLDVAQGSSAYLARRAPIEIEQNEFSAAIAVIAERINSTWGHVK